MVGVDSASGTHSALASSTAAVPLSASPNKVSAAAFFLPLRKTLVAPGLPEP